MLVFKLNCDDTIEEVDILGFDAQYPEYYVKLIDGTLVERNTIYEKWCTSKQEAILAGLKQIENRVLNAKETVIRANLDMEEFINTHLM